MDAGDLVPRALFQKRIDGDDALLRLARRRFDEAGLAAEVYAGSPAELDRVLGFAPPKPRPMVHLPRDLDLRDPGHRDRIRAIARSAGERVQGFVVHDQRAMTERPEDVERAARDLSAALTAEGSTLYLEYAARCSPEQFADLGRVLATVPGLGLCVDTGHVGVWQSRHAFAERRPDLERDLADLTPDDPALPGLVDDVVAAVATARPTVEALIDELAGLGAPLHVHAHDGHPLHPGLADHRGFLTWVPLPFAHDGRFSLDPMFGPAGLGGVVAALRRAAGSVEVSLTLEIHQGVDRLPVFDAADLFPHWRDLTNAERMNAWLAELSRNAQLVRAAGPSATWPPSAGRRLRIEEFPADGAEGVAFVGSEPGPESLLDLRQDPR